MARAEDERAAEARRRREKEAGDDAYRNLFLETAVLHYTRGAFHDPHDVSFLTTRAAAYFLISKYKECVRDCDEAVARCRELSASDELAAEELSHKASALRKLAERYGAERLAKQDETETSRKEIEEDREKKGNEFFENKRYQEAGAEYTRAMKINPNDARVFSNRSHCQVYLGAPPQGLEDAEKCIELDATFSKRYLSKTIDQILMGNYESAVPTYQECYSRLLSEHDRLLHEQGRAVREVHELRQKRDQILSFLRTAMHNEFSSSELECATDNFSSSLKIGEGTFGCVYRGFLRNMTVAIKVLRPDGLQGRSEFEQEVAILSRVRHPNLVTLLGACSESSTLVYEFLPNGSLEDFLVCADKRQTLTWQIRVRIIAEICSALIFLHKNRPHPVIHGDLKPANILLDGNLVSKLSDFGISRLLIQSSTNNTTLYRRTMHPMGTPMYMDPEFLATGEMTPRSDVYSFGIVVLRLLTGKPPVGIRTIVKDAMEQSDLNSVIDASAGQWPDVHLQQLAYLALSCTEVSRRCRPDSGELWRAIEAMRDAATLSLPPSSRSVPDENRIPSYFICPISQDVMDDPHIAADGFTYEGDCIRGWLSTGHNTSPMTNLPLQHHELTPNLALRSAIQEWLQQQNTAS